MVGAFCLPPFKLCGKTEVFLKSSLQGSWGSVGFGFLESSGQEGTGGGGGINLEQANYGICYRYVSLPGLIRYNWEIKAKEHTQLPPFYLTR